MNQYKNNVGFHTPQMSEESFNRFVKECPNANFDDSSWHNDASDSIIHWIDEDKGTNIQVWFPNTTSEEVDYETTFNHFAVFMNDEPQDTINVLTIDEAIAKVNELLN